MILPELLGTSPGLARVREQLARVVGQGRGAGRLPPVLIQGETGTGKGLLARALHDASARRAGPFVDVNCAAIPAPLLESEMFGYERGAFTDARQAKPGLFQAATHGSIFLDEIGLLPEALQGKLLKVVEERTVRRLGATRNEPVDAWVIAATSEDLEAATRDKRFRRDLYHRLAVVTVRLPPLRERGEDLLVLAAHFLARACVDYGHPSKVLSEDARAALRAHDWPGNVRELANVMERAVLLSDARVVSAEALELPASGPEPREAEPEPAAGGSLRERLRGAEREQLLQVLQETDWNLSRAAAQLGLPRNTLLYRMERQGLRPPPPSRRRAPEALTAAADPAAAGATPVGPRRVALLRLELAPDGGPRGDDGRILGAIAEKVNGFGGRVEELAATHVVAVFGIEPVEDAPRRAALAALAVQKAAERPRRETETPWSVRAAVHVAECVLGGPGNTALLGGADKEEAWALLAAVAGAAAPGTVAATAAASRFLERRFELVPTPEGGGPASWRLSGPEGAGFALHGRTTAFTGRQHELVLLESRLDSAVEGRGQVVAIAGEPGMGKSRLLSQFRQAVAGRPVNWLQGHCLSYASATPYHGVLDVLRQACGIADGDGAPVIAEKLGGAVQDAGLAAEDTLYLLHLLDPAAAAEPLRHVGPEQLKARTFDVFRRMLYAGRRRPLVVALEDLHWVDTTSDEVVALLVESLAAAPVLLVVTYRPGYHASWLGRSYATQLSLAPLSNEDSLIVLRSALERARLPPETLAFLAGRGDGNPFFLEELARAFGEQGEDAAPMAVPETIQGVLGGRIDRLAPSDKRLLQAAAVVGRDVPLAVLRAVAGEPQEGLSASLDRLRAAEFLYEARPAPLAYTFQHSLTQEVAYGTLALGQRRELHGRVADVLMRGGADVGASRPEVVARHLTVAERTAEAIPYWLGAGRDATRRSANVEAVSHLKTALGLLAGEPASAPRDDSELELQLSLGAPLIMTQGYASAEVESVYRRAEDLCAQMSETPQLFSALWGISVFHLVRGDLHSARPVAERLLSVATGSGRDDLEVEAHLAFGAVLFHQGFLADAREHLVRCDSLYDPGRHAGHAFLYGQDPQVAALGFLGRALLLLGEETEAVACIDRALRRAEAIEHPFSRGFAQLNAAALYELLGDWRSVVPYTEGAIALATEHRFPYLLGAGIALRGHVLVSEGRYAEGLPLIQQGLDTWRATGATLSLAHYLGVVADAHRADGHPERGLPLIAEALAAVARSGEFLSEPELHRIHGELLAADPGTEREAPAAFERALGLARAHGAQLHARRAEESLARYLRARERGGA